MSFQALLLLFLQVRKERSSGHLAIWPSSEEGATACNAVASTLIFMATVTLYGDVAAPSDVHPPPPPSPLFFCCGGGSGTSGHMQISPTITDYRIRTRVCLSRSKPIILLLFCPDICVFTVASLLIHTVSEKSTISPCFMTGCSPLLNVRLDQPYISQAQHHLSHSNGQDETSLNFRKSRASPQQIGENNPTLATQLACQSFRSK